MLQITKQPWMVIAKTLAVVLILLMMKYNATAGNKKDHSVTIPIDRLARSSVTISGTVMHERGGPFENAKIYMENVLVATTNKNGKYTFDFQIDGTARSYNITIVAEGMATLVRTYHPSMLSTTFDVTMTVFENDCCKKIIPPDIFTSFSHTFSRKSFALKVDEAMKATIATYAVELRNHPELAIEIIGHTGVESLDKARQERLRNYFVEKEGIAEERFVFVTEINKEPEARDVVEMRLRKIERNFD